MSAHSSEQYGFSSFHTGSPFIFSPQEAHFKFLTSPQGLIVNTKKGNLFGTLLRNNQNVGRILATDYTCLWFNLSREIFVWKQKMFRPKTRGFKIVRHWLLPKSFVLKQLRRHKGRSSLIFNIIRPRAESGCSWRLNAVCWSNISSFVFSWNDSFL